MADLPRGLCVEAGNRFCDDKLFPPPSGAWLLSGRLGWLGRPQCRLGGGLVTAVWGASASEEGKISFGSKARAAKEWSTTTATMAVLPAAAAAASYFYITTVWKQEQELLDLLLFSPLGFPLRQRASWQALARYWLS